jgi:hypothetical protein
MAISGLSQWIDVKDLEDYLGPNGFYGFGNLASCKYLFIGPEFGGCASLAETNKRIKAWKNLSSKACVDARSFHRKTGEFRWFGKDDKSEVKVRIQKTYGTLIRLLPLAWNNDKTLDRELVREYQRDKFGRLNGENCFIEVSAIQREGTSAHSPIVKAGIMELEQMKQDRAKWICTMISKKKNKNLQLVVLFGEAKRYFQNCKPHNVLVRCVSHPNARPPHRTDFEKEKKDILKQLGR